jgi:hypothetical protein
LIEKSSYAKAAPAKPHREPEHELAEASAD